MAVSERLLYCFQSDAKARALFIEQLQPAMRRPPQCVADGLDKTPVLVVMSGLEALGEVGVRFNQTQVEKLDRIRRFLRRRHAEARESRCQRQIWTRLINWVERISREDDATVDHRGVILNDGMKMPAVFRIAFDLLGWVKGKATRAVDQTRAQAR